MLAKIRLPNNADKCSAAPCRGIGHRQAVSESRVDERREISRFIRLVAATTEVMPI